MTEETKLTELLKAGLERSRHAGNSVIYDINQNGSLDPDYVHGYLCNCIAGLLGFGAGALGPERVRELIKLVEHAAECGIEFVESKMHQRMH